MSSTKKVSEVWDWIGFFAILAATMLIVLSVRKCTNDPRGEAPTVEQREK